MRAFIICSGWPLVGTVKTGTPRQTASQMVSLPVEQMIPAGAEGGAAGERSVERAVDLPRAASVCFLRRVAPVQRSK